MVIFEENFSSMRKHHVEVFKNRGISTLDDGPVFGSPGCC